MRSQLQMDINKDKKKRIYQNEGGMLGSQANKKPLNQEYLEKSPEIVKMEQQYSVLNQKIFQEFMMKYE